MAGRRRDPALDAAIRAAAAELLHERGWSGFTVEAVAARVGVPKSTVYKRWSSRIHLASALLDEWVDGVSAELQSILQSPAEHRLRLLVEMQRRFTAVPEGRALAEVLVSANDDAPIHDLRVRAADCRRICQQVVASVPTGLGAKAVDDALIADMLLGAIWLRSLPGFHDDDVSSDSFVKALGGLLHVDAVV